MRGMGESEPSGALAVARAYHDAWQRRDYQAAWQLLGDDLAVEVPVNSYDSKAAFTQAAQRTRDMAASVKPIAEFGNHGEAVLLYDMTLPIGDLRIAEYFRCRHAKIGRDSAGNKLQEATAIRRGDAAAERSPYAPRISSAATTAAGPAYAADTRNVHRLAPVQLCRHGRGPQRAKTRPHGLIAAAACKQGTAT